MLDGKIGPSRRVHLDGADLARMVQLDILDTITNLSNDEVFTPPRLANMVLDLLPAEIWQDPTIRVLDPFCKTGVFLREAVRRFMVGLAEVFPDPAERRAHILKNQVYGVAISEITWLMSRRTVYGSTDAAGDRAEALTTRMDRHEGNIIFPRREHDWDRNGKCRICGMGREIERDGMDNYAYALIHGGIEGEFGDVQFDVIIGNPPYQVKSGGFGAQATPIYNLFVEAAKSLRPRFLSMIIPARWYAGGMGLDSFRASMLSDPGMSKLVDIRNASEAFSGVEIKGGVCYFLREQGKRDHGCDVVNIRAGEAKASMRRRLDMHDVLIRDNEAISILNRVTAIHNGIWMSDRVSSVNPFGIATNFDAFMDSPSSDAVKVYARNKCGWIDPSIIAGKDAGKWKVMVSLAYNGGDALPHQIIGAPIIAEPGSCCTMTYLVVDSFDNEEEASRMSDYLRTKFVRFLISLKKNTQHLNRSRFSFVPLLPMTEVWTDDRLYEHFGIKVEEQAFIDSMIREM